MPALTVIPPCFLTMVRVRRTVKEKPESGSIERLMSAVRHAWSKSWNCRWSSFAREGWSMIACLILMQAYDSLGNVQLLIANGLHLNSL